MKGHIGETTQHQLLPEALAMLAPQPLLLPGERLEDYLILRQAVYAELAPRNAIEWLLTIDIAELSWEIQRYRILRHKLMEKSRQSAVAAALSQIDLIGIPFEWQEDAKRQTELNALAWRSNVDAASDIERRLALYGVDNFSINTEVHIQARVVYLMFEGLIVSAQARRIMLLREINNRRQSVRTSHRVPSPYSEMRSLHRCTGVNADK